MDPKLSLKQQIVHVWDNAFFVIPDLRMSLPKCESGIHALALNIFIQTTKLLLGHGSQTLCETATSSYLG